jgi:formate dehydrogenase subunit beta
LKIAAALKGCDVMRVYEQAKRTQVDLDLDNVLMIDLNCGGATTSYVMRRTMSEVFEWTQNHKYIII